MSRTMGGVRLASALAVVFSSAVSGQQITITTATEYQTVDGMGATIKLQQPSSTPVALHDSLSASIARFQIWPAEFGMEASGNDNGDPNVFDTNAYHVAAMNTFCGYLTYYHNVYPDFRFMISVMTPPAWMKDMSRDPSPTCSDGTSMCGGHLRSDMYEEFAEYLTAFVKRIKQLTGIDIFALSIQNEPAFIEWYVSCVYDVTEYVAAFRAVATRFRQQAIPARLFAAEDMTEAFTARAYIGNVMADTACRPSLYAFATHGYAADGVHPSTTAASTWSAIARAARMSGKKAWMTETSGYADDWATAIGYGQGIYTGMKYGQLAAWVWDTDGGRSCDYNYSLLCNNAHTNRSRISKHFYAAARPDAVMVDATSADTSVHVVAFNNKATQTLSIVMVNEGGAKSITLAGASLPSSLTKITTSQTKRYANEGTVSSSGSITIDASSVVTLTGTYTVGTLAPARRLPPSERGRSSAVFGIDGRACRDGAASGTLLIGRNTDGRWEIRTAALSGRARP